YTRIILMNATPTRSAPTTVKRTVLRGRLPNTHYRTHRDATTVLLAFRHGFRASELCALRWDQVDLVHGRLHVSRLKNGMPSVHPLTGIELRALRRLKREQEPGRYVFMSERGAPMSAAGFRRMTERLGKAAKMPFNVHPHMLRHAARFKLANQG